MQDFEKIVFILGAEKLSEFEQEYNLLIHYSLGDSDDDVKIRLRIKTLEGYIKTLKEILYNVS